MIEIIYNETEEKNDAVVIKPPKNIRQIGSPKGRHRIYIEDYVYTFLHSSNFEGETPRRAAVLLGKSEMSQDIRYTFIDAAINCDEFIFKTENIVFEEDCWEYIYKEIKTYFPRLEIVGWFLGMTGFCAELTTMRESAHRKYFPGREKVLFLSEPGEGEEVFFAYEQGILQKKEGFYIYYEKNIAMQEYMVHIKEKKRVGEGGGYEALEESEWSHVDSVDAKKEVTPAEQALAEYRNMLLKKKQGVSLKPMNFLLYTAASAAMIVLCIIGITTINNYEKMKEVQETLAGIVTTTDEKEALVESDISVETVPGEIENKIQETTAEPTIELVAEQTVEPVTEPAVELVIEPSAEPGEAAIQEAVEPSYQEQGYYIVQPGDRLELICKEIYQTTDKLDELCAANQIEDVDKIFAGQKLVLP